MGERHVAFFSISSIDNVKQYKEYARDIMTEDIDLIRITDVEYIKDYTMQLEFSNGKVKVIDFLPPDERETVRAAERPEQLRPVWPYTLDAGMYNGDDFALDCLYCNGVEA